jgi:hypothetical protein
MTGCEPIEFIHGPVDGRQRINCGLPSTLIVDELTESGIVGHTYRLRTVDGIPNRSANGCFAYVWMRAVPYQTDSKSGAKEQTDGN